MNTLKQSLLFAACAMVCTTVSANDVDVKTFRYAGPFDLPAPILVDSVDAKQKTFATETLLNTPLHLNSKHGQRTVVSQLLCPTPAAI